jgi:hypothetical protein
MLGMMLGNVIIIMYGGGFLILAAIITLLVMSWKRKEPLHLQQEKLQDAIGWKHATRNMARDLERALQKNPTMTPAEITTFVEGWGPDSFDVRAMSIATAPKPKPSTNKEGADAELKVEPVEPVE